MLRGVTRRLGYDLVEYPSRDFHRRMKLLRRFGVDLVLDVGADTGEYVQKLRRYGYHGRVVSFEPLSASFSLLQASAAGDAAWETVNTALGDAAGSATIHVAGNLHSSSLRDMLPAHQEAAPQSAYVAEERIAVRRLDEVFAEYARDARRPYLKIDTQGFEKNVLDGAAGVLDRVAGVQIELSLVPLYAGQALLPELVDYLVRRGFTLMSLEPGFCDERSGQMLQADGVFFRNVE
jgi:FkbM family methyltransferase